MGTIEVGGRVSSSDPRDFVDGPVIVDVAKGRYVVSMRHADAEETDCVAGVRASLADTSLRSADVAGEISVDFALVGP